LIILLLHKAMRDLVASCHYLKLQLQLRACYNSGSGRASSSHWRVRR
jgi:hypothetical protein